MMEQATRLEDVLARENAALSAMDMRAACQLLPEKQDAVAAFAAAAAQGTMAPADAERLALLTAQNKGLLERAMATQQALLSLVVESAREAQAPLGYGMGGAPVGRGGPMALSAQA